MGGLRFSRDGVPRSAVNEKGPEPFGWGPRRHERGTDSDEGARL